MIWYMVPHKLETVAVSEETKTKLTNKKIKVSDFWKQYSIETWKFLENNLAPCNNAVDKVMVWWFLGNFSRKPKILSDNCSSKILNDSRSSTCS